jgi:hypothetical protein
MQLLLTSPNYGNMIKETLVHQQGIICGVAFDRSSLRRISTYASVVAPRRLASNTLLVIRHAP